MQLPYGSSVAVSGLMGRRKGLLSVASTCACVVVLLKKLLKVFFLLFLVQQTVVPEKFSMRVYANYGRLSKRQTGRSRGSTCPKVAAAVADVSGTKKEKGSHPKLDSAQPS